MRFQGFGDHKDIAVMDCWQFAHGECWDNIKENYVFYT